MKNFYIICSFVLLLLFKTNFSAQHTSNNLIVNVPNVLPPSPSSSFKTDFGNLVINEYYGMPSVSIPIYNFNQGSISHNISLNYSKLGVKVNEIPDVAGVSWLLNVGGVINRIVYEFPDEKKQRFLVNDPLALNIQNLQEGSPEALALIDKIKNINIDNEVDVFSFSVDEYSGTFYLDQNFQPVMLEAGKGIKIQTVGSFSTNYEFLLMAPNGKKYFFGGTGFTEETYNRDDGSTNAVTGFYLSKIQDGNNIVEFNYYTDTHRTISVAMEQSKGLTFQRNYVDYVATNCGAPSPYPFTQKINNLNIRYPKKLKEILYGDNKITFNYLPASGQEYGKINNIQVSSYNTVKKQFDFNYLDKKIGDVIHRFFLEKISFFEVKENQKHFKNDYILEYDDPLSIPERMSKSVDVLGYYNGQHNSTYIPNLALLGAIGFDQPLDADRRAYFNYAKKGTLKSITYPTKGKTSFEYESVPVKKPTYVDFNLLIGNNAFIFDLTSLPAIYEASKEYQFNPIVSGKIKIDLTLVSEIEQVQTQKGDALFEIIDKSTNQVVYSKEIMLGKTVFTGNWKDEFTVDKLKTYLIKFKIKNYCNQCNGAAKIEYQSGYHLEDGIGLRLKRQSDKDGNSETNIKRIYYSKISDINNLELIPENRYSVGLFTSTYYKQFLPQSHPVNTDPGTTPGESDADGCAMDNYYIRQMIVHSEPVRTNDFGIMGYGGLIDNPIVSISYGGDNFENGGEEKEFLYNEENAVYSLKEPNYNPLTFADSPDILSIIVGSFFGKLERKVNFKDFNGLVKRNLFLKNTGNNNLVVTRKIENLHERSETASVSNLVGMPIYDVTFMPTGSVAGGELFNLLIAFYKSTTYFNRLTKAITTDYFENVPYDTTDDSIYKKTSTETNYLYDNLVKMPSLVSSKFSDGTIIQSSYKYAQDKGNQRLVAANKIGVALETEVKKNNKTVSKNETFYDDVSHLFPTSVQSLNVQSNLMSTEITYDKYDSSGNLQQYTSRNGISTTIIWGYNKTQPIAKIEGAKLSDISQTLIDSIVNASATDAQQGTDASEQSFISALDLFRNNSAFSNYQISTYTYDPLIGVKSITPPSGIREIYVYDTANRLKEVKQLDKYVAGNPVYKIVKEYKYNYKN